jgi:hypothetical protein
MLDLDFCLVFEEVGCVPPALVVVGARSRVGHSGSSIVEAWPAEMFSSDEVAVLAVRIFVFCVYVCVEDCEESEAWCCW